MVQELNGCPDEVIEFQSGDSQLPKKIPEV